MSSTKVPPSSADLLATLRRDQKIIFAILVVIPLCVFGSTWGEEFQHTWYSLGARSIGDQLDSLGANNFGKQVLIGVPIYDFAIGIGARLPLNVGSFVSPLVLLRGFVPAELIPVLYFIVVSYLATSVVSSTLWCLGIRSRLPHSFVVMSLAAVPMFYVTQFDWYSMSVGYLLTCVVVSILVLVMADSDELHQRSRAITRSFVLLVGCFTTAYVSYWHTFVVVLACGILCAPRTTITKVWYEVRFRKHFAPLVGLTLLGVGLILMDLRAETKSQYQLSRIVYETTLASPTEGWAAIKHLGWQLVIGEARGIIGLIRPSLVEQYSSSNVPATIFPMATVFGLTMLMVQKKRPIRHIVDTPTVRFLLGLILTGAVLPWFPRLKDSIEVSDRNVFTHASGMASLYLIALVTRARPQVSWPRQSWLCQSVLRLAVLTSFVCNAALLVPSELIKTLRNRQTLISPTSVVGAINSPDDSAHLLSSIPRGVRVLSFTEAFDSQKYFQTAVADFHSYNDVTQQLIPTVNSYPKLRNHQNIADSSRFSLSLAPSSLSVDTGDYCPIEQASFLAVKMIVLSEQQERDCQKEILSRSITRTIIADRDGIRIVGHEIEDGPIFVRTSRAKPVQRCAILTRECWSELGWRKDSSVRLQLRVGKIPQSHDSLTINVIGEISVSGALVLPLAYDDRIRIINARSRAPLEVTDVNGFAAVDTSAVSNQATLAATINPDGRMWMYAIYPYAWLIVAGTSYLLWRKRSR